MQDVKTMMHSILCWDTTLLLSQNKHCRIEQKQDYMNGLDTPDTQHFSSICVENKLKLQHLLHKLC